MDLAALSSIENFTSTALLATAGICLAAVFVAWYTVRRRIKLSQVILGAFAYVLVMLLENVFAVGRGAMGAGDSGIGYAALVTVSIVMSHEIVRYAMIRFGLIDRFGDTDAAIGFGLGLAGLYLMICAAYYFNCYTAVSAYLADPETFFASTGADAQEAYELLKAVASQTSWQFVFTGVNRAFLLVREISLSVLVWYGFRNEKMRRCLILVPMVHFLAMLPDGLFQAEVVTNPYGKDIATYIITGGIAALAAKAYNRLEDQVVHFQVEKLRARRRK